MRSYMLYTCPAVWAFTQHFSMLCMPLLIGMQQYQVNQNHDTEYTTLIMPEAPAASAEQQRPP